MTHGEVSVDPIGSSLADENWSVFLAFPAHHEFTSFGVNVITIKINKFRDTQAAREEKLNNSTVAEASFARDVDLFDEATDFIVLEEGNLFAGSFLAARFCRG